MKIKKIAIIGVTALALTMVGTSFARSPVSVPLKQSSQSNTNTQKTTVKIKNTNLLNTLELNSNIVISAEDVTNAKVDNKDKTFNLGTFCTYTNHPKRQMELTATNNEGAFVMKGKNSIGNVDYSVKFNKQDVAYNEALIFKPTGNNNHVDCRDSESISVTIAAPQLAAAKAGTYDISLNLATANLNN